MWCWRNVSALAADPSSASCTQVQLPGTTASGALTLFWSPQVSAFMYTTPLLYNVYKCKLKGNGILCRKDTKFQAILFHCGSSRLNSFPWARLVYLIFSSTKCFKIITNSTEHIILIS